MIDNTKEKKEGSVFDGFTRKYQLSKTLRFELRPILNTPKMLDDEQVIKNDETRRKKYEAVKPWFDQLHREFIEDALKSFKFKNLAIYQDTFQTWQKDRKSKQKKDTLVKIEVGLREEIVRRFEEVANIWVRSEQYKLLGIKKEGVGMLFEAGVFRLLKERFKNEKDTTVDGNNIFDEWTRWTGYFKKFFETRKNFYKSDDTSTAIAYRVINQNLRRFCENIQIFEKISEKIEFSEVEKSFDISCAGIFSLAYYNACLLQGGIDTYNKIIGGEVDEKDKKIPGINELINKYRQDNSGEKIPFLKQLDKQIHSAKEAFIESIETNKELVGKLKTVYENAEVKIQSFRNLIEDIVTDYSGYDIDKIYLTKEAVSHNASRWFASFESFERDLFAVVAEKQNKLVYELLRTHKNDSKISDKDGKFSFPDFIKCSHIKRALEKQEGRIWKGEYYEDIVDFEKIKDVFTQFLCVFKFELEQQFFRKTTSAQTGEQTKIGYEIFVTKINELITRENPVIDLEEKIAIKNFTDATLLIYQIAKYFAVEKRRGWLDNYDLDDRFYKSSDIGYLNFYRDAFEQIVRPYNLFRNYLTKKPYNTNKWVLSFENPTLADGWDKNKEKTNAAVILRKDGRYYLGIIKEDCKSLFADRYSKEMSEGIESGSFQKMAYKFFPEASKMIPKCSTQTKNVKEHFRKSSSDYNLFHEKDYKISVALTKNIYELNNVFYRKDNIEESFVPKNDFEKKLGVKKFQRQYLEISRDNNGYKQALAQWIEFCIRFLKAYKSTTIFDYSRLREAKEYESLDAFYQDINALTYNISFVPISEQYIKEKNDNGELFLFEIYNKDWSLGPMDKNRKRTKNLHTLYFEQLFSKENEQENFLFQLNGEAELFFRPKTEEKRLGYKVWDAGEKKWVKAKEKEDGAVIDRKRYAKDIILFHCPITLNRVSESKTKREMDVEIREVLSSTPGVHIIGVDRGEKHLAYYSVIDQNGKIIETDTLNSIGKDGRGKPVEYASKLEKRAQEREASRRDWEEVKAIKDLKKGYISQVIRNLADLIIKHNAIIVFEDLNMRFKQIRGGIEKSAYQQLERALIDKLSFLVKKGEEDPKQTGHILRAYQLAAPVIAFKDMGKQTGLIFYTQAGYTSKTCR